MPETWTERIDVTPPHAGDALGTMSIEVKPGSVEQSAIEALGEENRRMHDRITELEAEVARLHVLI